MDQAVKRPYATTAPRAVPLPADFASRAGSAFNPELMAHYHVGVDVIRRWRKESGVRCPERAVNKIDAPQSFPLVAPTMTRKELAAHFKVSRDTIQRWQEESGILPKPAPAFGGKRHVSTISAADRKFGTTTIIVRRDETRAGQAATFLQRFGPVYKCRPDGRADANGSHWSRAGHVLTGDEIIDRAVRNGWQPEAWRLVA